MPASFVMDLLTSLPTIGRKRVAVAALLVTLVMAAVIKDNKPAIMYGGKISNAVNCSLIHSERPDF